MDGSLSRRARGVTAGALLGLLVLSAAGCNMVSAVSWVIWGNNRPAEFNGLKKRKVAVVCRQSGGKLHQPGMRVDDEIGERVARLLRRELGKSSNVVDYSKVAEYTDRNEWEKFTEVGHDMDAEMVVAVELTSFSASGGSTVHHGKADVRITVYDLTQDDRVVYGPVARSLEVGPRDVENVTLPQFREEFLQYVSSHIARHFYAHDATVDFGH